MLVLYVHGNLVLGCAQTHHWTVCVECLPDRLGLFLAVVELHFDDLGFLPRVHRLQLNALAEPLI